MKDYNPQDWYWVVGGDQTKVYSSRIGDYVLPTDADYLSWCQDGSLPSRVPAESDLGELLAVYSLRPGSATVLDGYKDAQAKVLNIQTVAKVLFYLVNQVRALQGKDALTAAQFRQQIKDLM